MIKNRGQISIFAIVGIVIVAGIILFFAIYQAPTLIKSQEFNPQNYIQTCVRDEVRRVSDIMLPQGGFVSPTDYKIYNDTKVTYLCKNVNYYKPCIIQYPRYIVSLQKELENNTRQGIITCFSSLQTELEKRNYEMKWEDPKIDVTLKPGVVEFNVLANLSITKDQSTQQIKTISTSIKSPLYNLGYLANEISSQEAKFCYFEYVGYMLIYKDIDIRKYTMSDSTKIYTLQDKKSGKIMNIATRGCALPAGF